MWGDSIIRYLDKRSPEDKARASLLNNSKDLSQSKQFIATSGKASQGNFCSLCGAWRGELGLEPTFELYIKHLLQIFTEVKRVLKKTGTCWVNLGDSYSGSNCGSNDYRVLNGENPKYNHFAEVYKGQKPGKTSVAAKSLCCIPDRFKVAMVDSGWICRNEIIWFKHNCMPSSASDRFTVDFEKIFFFSKQGKYYFEQMFEENQTTYAESWGNFKRNKVVGAMADITMDKDSFDKYRTQGRNMRTVWQINTKPFKDAHFAVFPPELPRRCITAGCPKDICSKCGFIREKLYKRETQESLRTNDEDINNAFRGNAPRGYGGQEVGYTNAEFIGYSTCDCSAGWDKGIVLDPFMGSGTTALVAKQLGRNWVGIELNEEYIKMAEERINREPEPLF